ncbi:unnamed protein product [Somion occarium]|uniref:Nickel/cobalt efflux system n=1 Tax=Somion occarium TaxID=3059160 RepID=A0ABP1DYR4_9APHY
MVRVFSPLPRDFKVGLDDPTSSSEAMGIPTRILTSMHNRLRSLPRLTLFGRSLLLLVSELVANAICWIVAGILFGRHRETQPILSLALLAWTIGLRHALDADHISAIDNATRALINLDQLPVTCGLFFSLGHSTIVIVVNVAIAISTSVYDKIDGVGRVGGIVGASVSATFLFIVGLANSIILWRIIARRRRMRKERAARLERGEVASEIDEDMDDSTSHGNTLMMKIIGPIVRFVDRPWKMYPVGVLFGFGFDTASSIALLAVSAIAKNGTNGARIAPANIVILPLLFTAGMTLVDSLDSILMLYSYAGFPERSFALFERRNTDDKKPILSPSPVIPPTPPSSVPAASGKPIQELHRELSASSEVMKPLKPAISEEPPAVVVSDVSEQMKKDLRVRRNAMSGLSVILTLMSILVAFSISLITIMGLIGENCSSCQAAADDPDGGELAGRWWRGWANANENSGYIGAAIVGAFIFVVGTWYGSRYLWRKWSGKHRKGEGEQNETES